MAGKTVCPILTGEGASAMHCSPRPLHSGAEGNEIGKVDFAPGGQAKLWGNHRAT
jgi:hypothetical protein